MVTMSTKLSVMSTLFQIITTLNSFIGTRDSIEKKNPAVTRYKILFCSPDNFFSVDANEHPFSSILSERCNFSRCSSIHTWQLSIELMYNVLTIFVTWRKTSTKLNKRHTVALWDKTRSFWDNKNSLSHERGSERYERASEWAQQGARAKRAVRSQRTSERCK